MGRKITNILAGLQAEFKKIEIKQVFTKPPEKKRDKKDKKKKKKKHKKGSRERGSEGHEKRESEAAREVVPLRR